MVKVQIFLLERNRVLQRHFETWNEYTGWLLGGIEAWRKRGLLKRAYRTAPTASSDLTEVVLPGAKLEFFAREVA